MGSRKVMLCMSFVQQFIFVNLCWSPICCFLSLWLVCIGAYNAARISEVMDLQSLSENHPWLVIETQASTGEGLQEAFKTMARMVKQFHKDSSKADIGNAKSGDATEV